MVAEKKLLIAVDGSDNSLRALFYVIKRAAADERLRIYVLNVQPALPPSFFVTRTMIKNHYEANSKESLARARRALAKTHLTAEVAVRVGPPAETILNFASTEALRRDRHGHARTGISPGSLARVHHDQGHPLDPRAGDRRAMTQPECLHSVQQRGEQT